MAVTESMASKANHGGASKAPADYIAALLSSLGQRFVSSKLISLTFGALFALIIVGLAASNYVKPDYNWDLAPYLAAAMDDGGLSNEELHSRSWSLIEEETEPHDFAKLVTNDDYRIHQYANPDDFASMLPMYAVKAGYVGLGKMLGQLVGPIRGFHLISVLSAVLLGFVVLNWLRWGKAMHTAPLALAIVLILGYVGLGRAAMPDMLTAAFLVWGCERYMRGQEWAGIALLFVSFLIRPDGILFLFALLLAVIAFGHRLLPAAAGFAASVAAYLAITSGSEHPGWWVHFYFSAVEIQNSMIGFDPAFDVVAFAKAYARGIIVGLRDHTWWAVLAILLMGWGLLAKAGKRSGGRAFSRASTVMLWACLMAIGGKFLLFPLPESRVYFGPLVVMTLVLLTHWRPDLCASSASESFVDAQDVEPEIAPSQDSGKSAPRVLVY